MKMKTKTKGADHISRDFIWILFLTVSVPVFFGKVMLSGKSLYGSDFILQFFPWKNFLYEAVKMKGSLPFWNPYLFSGTPFIANIQASMFYPPGFLYYLLPTDTAYLYTTLLHCILGAIFMYLFMRFLKCSRAGAFLSGFIFIYNGYFMAHIYAGHLSFVQNYIWIPLIFLFTTKFMETREVTNALWAGLVLGIQILGGFPQIAFYTLLAILLLCFYFSWTGFQTIGLSEQCRIWAGTIFLIFLGFSIAAIQLFPTYEFTQLSTRAGGIGYEFATMDSLPPKNLLTFFFPLLFGSPVDGSYWVNEKTWEFWEYCGYTGLVSIVAVLFAVGKLRSSRMGLFFVFLGLTAILLSFGKYNPLYPLIYHLPGFNTFRIPAQILFLYVFAIAVLCGKSLDILVNFRMFHGPAKCISFSILVFCLPVVIWSSAFPEGFRRFVFDFILFGEGSFDRVYQIAFTVSQALFKGYCLFFAVFVAFYLKGKGSISRGLFTGIWVGLIMMELGTFSFPLIRTFDMRKVLKEGRTIQYLKDNPGISRSLIDGKCLIENAGLWYGFQDVQGYDPLILRRYMEYVNKSQGLVPDNKVVNLHYIKDYTQKLIRMLNLEFVVACGAGRIIKVDPFIPRCYLVHAQKIMHTDEILNFMMAESFNPQQTVVFESSDAPRNFSPRKPARDAKESCRITRYENDKIKLVADLQAPGFLVLSEISYPGWQAYVDGKKSDIFTGNYLFRVLPLLEGHHEISFIFRPLSFKIGAGISLAALLGAIFLIFWNFGAKRRQWVK